MSKKKPSKNKGFPAKEMASKPDSRAVAPSWFEVVLNFILKFQRFAKDIAGIVLLVFASLTLLSLIGLTSGAWLTPWATWLRRWFGIGSVFLVLGLGIGGLLLIRNRQMIYLREIGEE